MAIHLTLSRNRRIILVLWLFLYASFTLLAPPLLDGADAVNAEIAREMIVRHDVVTMHVNGMRSLAQAPALYWSMAASMKLLGVGTVQARLPLAVFALLLFLLTERFARRAYRSERSGLYAAVGLMLSFGIFVFTRILIPEAVVCLWLTAAIYCVWMTEQQEGQPGYVPALGFGAVCALNVLTKGVSGMVLPIATLLLYLLLTRGVRGCLRRARQLHPLAALLSFLLLEAPWHVAAARATPAQGHPPGLTHTSRWLPMFWKGWHASHASFGNVHGWTWFDFLNHPPSSTNLLLPRDYTTVPLLLFWALLLVWMMPWGAFLWHAVRAIPLRNLRDLGQEDRTALLVALAAVVPLVFVSFSVRHAYYAPPSLPFLAMLLARWLDREAIEAEVSTIPPVRSQSGLRIATALFVSGSALALVCTLVLLYMPASAGIVDPAQLLVSGMGGSELPFRPSLDMNAAAISFFRDPLMLLAVAMFFGTGAAWWLRRDYKPHHANVALAAATLLFLVAAHKALQTLAPVLSSEPLVRQLQRQELTSDDLIVINGDYESASTLGFYLRRIDLHLWHGESSNLWSGSFFADAPDIIETDATMRFRWDGVQRVFVWTEEGKLPALPGKVYVVAEGGGKMIVSNKLGAY